MTRPEETQPPLPCGEGAGGEGRADAQVPDGLGPSPAETSASERPSSPDPFSAREKGRSKLGHGWAPAPGEDRQKDRRRTNARAARLRKEMTSSEKELWRLLRSIEGHTFRRQPAIGDYVYDFGCYSARLLIEIDGSIHRLPEVQQNDKAKTIHAALNDFRLLRFVNNDVWDRPQWVLGQVRALLDAPHPPTPSPQGRGGEVL